MWRFGWLCVLGSVASVLLMLTPTARVIVALIAVGLLGLGVLFLFLGDLLPQRRRTALVTPTMSRCGGFVGFSGWTRPDAALAGERDRHRVGAHAVARDAAGRVRCAEEIRGGEQRGLSARLGTHGHRAALFPRFGSSPSAIGALAGRLAPPR